MESFKLIGSAYFELRQNGKVIDKWEVNNIIVNDGKERVAKLIGALSSTGFQYIGIGEGATGATVNDSELETEQKRTLATIAYEASNKVIFEKTFSFASGESFAITEAGLFDSLTASGSIMLDRLVFSAKNVDSEIDLYVKITITVT